jgi:hypothetical protein
MLAVLGFGVIGILGCCAIGVVVTATVIATMRRLNRGTSGEPPRVITHLAATAVVSDARSRDGLVALIVTLVTAGLWSQHVPYSAFVLLWVVICISDYVVAHRALRLLDKPHAIAELYGMNLVVRSGDRTSAVLLSRRETRRVCGSEVPTATLAR